MVSITARYLNGCQITLENCETVGGVMVQVAVLHDRFAHDIAVFCPDTHHDLTKPHSQVPPPQVSVVLKQGTDPPAEEDLKLALKLHAEQEDTETCVRALEVMRQSYPQACPGDILLDVVKDGAETRWKMLSTLLRAGVDGTAALHSFATAGDGDALQALLSGKVDPDNKATYGTTALLIACTKGHEKNVEILLSSGADVNSVNTYGASLLMRAAAKGYDTIVEMLLSNGADVNHADKYGSTALSKAASGGYDTIVEMLLSNGADMKKYGGKALKNASYRHVKTVKMLLSYNADANYADENGQTAMHTAIMSDRMKATCSWCHGEIVKALLFHGANVNQSAKDGHNALTLASMYGYDKTVEMLLSFAADINHTEQHGATPLIEASQNGHQEIVEILLRHGADVNCADENGDTALAPASNHGRDKVTTMLSNWVNMNHVSKVGISAHTQDFKASHSKIVDVPQSNSDENHVDMAGVTSTAVTRASETDDCNTVEAELSNGYVVSHADTNMDTSLTRAFVRNQERSVDILQPNGKEVKHADRHANKPKKRCCRCFF